MEEIFDAKPAYFSVQPRDRSMQCASSDPEYDDRGWCAVLLPRTVVLPAVRPEWIYLELNERVR